MNKMPQVSIIIPVYNCQKYVGRCIESLQRQSLSDIEILLVNDCSTDSSIEIINQYKKTDTRLILINHQKNLGPMMARYNGYKIAKGNYITFVDSDDTLPYDALYKLVTKARQSGADIVSGIVEYIKNNGERHKWTNSLRYGTDKQSIFKSMLEGQFCHNLCSRLFTRSIIQNYQYKNYDNLLNGEDGLLFYQIVDNCSMVTTLNSVVYEYWQNMQSSSQRKFSDSQMNSYFFTISEQYLIVRKYKPLVIAAQQYVVRSIIQLYSIGYSKKVLRKYIEKYNFQSILSYISILKLFHIKMALKYCIQKILFPIIRNAR